MGYAILLFETVFIIYHSIIKKRELSKYRGYFYFSYIFLIIGSMGPDIIDKLIIYPILGIGRHIGHTLLFNVLICLMIFLIFRKHKRFYMSFIIGWQLHLILDLGGFIPWLYPFKQYVFVPKDASYFQLLLQPSVYINEIIGFGVMITIFLVIYLRNKIGLFKIIKEDIKTH